MPTECTPETTESFLKDYKVLLHKVDLVRENIETRLLDANQETLVNEVTQLQVAAFAFLRSVCIRFERNIRETVEAIEVHVKDLNDVDPVVDVADSMYFTDIFRDLKTEPSDLIPFGAAICAFFSGLVFFPAWLVLSACPMIPFVVYIGGFFEAYDNLQIIQRINRPISVLRQVGKNFIRYLAWKNVEGPVQRMRDAMVVSGLSQRLLKFLSISLFILVCGSTFVWTVHFLKAKFFKHKVRRARRESRVKEAMFTGADQFLGSFLFWGFSSLFMLTSLATGNIMPVLCLSGFRVLLSNVFSWWDENGETIVNFDAESTFDVKVRDDATLIYNLVTGHFRHAKRDLLYTAKHFRFRNTHVVVTADDLVNLRIPNSVRVGLIQLGNVTVDALEGGVKTLQCDPLKHGWLMKEDLDWQVEWFINENIGVYIHSPWYGTPFYSIYDFVTNQISTTVKVLTILTIGIVVSKALLTLFDTYFVAPARDKRLDQKRLKESGWDEEKYHDWLLELPDDFYDGPQDVPTLTLETIENLLNNPPPLPVGAQPTQFEFSSSSTGIVSTGEHLPHNQQEVNEALSNAVFIQQDDKVLSEGAAPKSPREDGYLKHGMESELTHVYHTLQYGTNENVCTTVKFPKGMSQPVSPLDDGFTTYNRTIVSARNSPRNADYDSEQSDKDWSEHPAYSHTDMDGVQWTTKGSPFPSDSDSEFDVVHDPSNMYSNYHPLGYIIGAHDKRIRSFIDSVTPPNRSSSLDDVLEFYEPPVMHDPLPPKGHVSPPASVDLSRYQVVPLGRDWKLTGKDGKTLTYVKYIAPPPGPAPGMETEPYHHLPTTEPTDETAAQEAETRLANIRHALWTVLKNPSSEALKFWTKHFNTPKKEGKGDPWDIGDWADITDEPGYGEFTADEIASLKEQNDSPMYIYDAKGEQKQRRRDAYNVDDQDQTKDSGKFEPRMKRKKNARYGFKKFRNTNARWIRKESRLISLLQDQDTGKVFEIGFVEGPLQHAPLFCEACMENQRICFAEHVPLNVYFKKAQIDKALTRWKALWEKERKPQRKVKSETSDFSFKAPTNTKPSPIVKETLVARTLIKAGDRVVHKKTGGRGVVKSIQNHLALVLYDGTDTPRNTPTSSLLTDDKYVKNKKTSESSSSGIVPHHYKLKTNGKIPQSVIPGVDYVPLAYANFVHGVFLSEQGERVGFCWSPAAGQLLMPYHQYQLLATLPGGPNPILETELATKEAQFFVSDWNGSNKILTKTQLIAHGDFDDPVHCTSVDFALLKITKGQFYKVAPWSADPFETCTTASMITFVKGELCWTQPFLALKYGEHMASTDSSTCGSPIWDAKTRKIIGYHVAGGHGDMNFFTPMHSIAKILKENGPKNGLSPSQN